MKANVESVDEKLQSRPICMGGDFKYKNDVANVSWAYTIRF
jgi:hypothetical protein